MDIYRTEETRSLSPEHTLLNSLESNVDKAQDSIENKGTPEAIKQGIAQMRFS